MVGALLGGLTALALSWLGSSPDAPVPRPHIRSSALATDSTDLIGAAASATDHQRATAGGGFDPQSTVLGHGLVLDEVGQPVLDSRITFEDVEARQTTAAIGMSGAWSLPGLQPGTFTVSIRKEGYIPILEDVEVPAEATWRQDFVLHQALSLPVRFETPDGVKWEFPRFAGTELSSSLGVAVTRDAPSERVNGVIGRTARYSEGGFYESRDEVDDPNALGLEFHGLLKLHSKPPVWVSAVVRDVVLSTRRISGDEDDLVFVVDPEQLALQEGTVRVRIVDADTGEAITAGVELGFTSGGFPFRPVVEGDSCVFRGVVPGGLDLTLNSLDFEHLERHVDVLPGQLVDLGTIEIGRRAPFVIHLRDSAGEPVSEGVNLAVLRQSLQFGPNDFNARISTAIGVDGEVQVTWLSPGPTLIVAGGANGLARTAKVVDTRDEPVVDHVLPSGTPVTLRLRTHAVHGDVHRLMQEDGSPLYSGTRLPRETYLARGSYTLSSYRRGDELSRMQFVVSGDRSVVTYGEE